MDSKTQYLDNVTYYQINIQIKCNSSQNQTGSFVHIDKLLLKLTWRQPANYKQKTILRKKDNLVDSPYHI